MSDTKQNPGVQGEGDYQAARHHRRDVQQFVAENDENAIEQIARDAAPRSEGERREMLEAERQGRARAKGRTPGNSPSDK